MINYDLNNLWNTISVLECCANNVTFCTNQEIKIETEEHFRYWKKKCTVQNFTIYESQSDSYRVTKISGS